MLRLADLLASLSRCADLGFGLPAGEAVRSSALALQIGRSLDLDDDELRGAMYGALLFHLGCVGYSHESARMWGDELVANAAIARTNVASAWDVAATFLPAVLRGRSARARARTGLDAMVRGRRFGREYESAACEVGREAARRLRLPEDVQRAVYHTYERWNGGGVPDRLEGDEIPVASRLAAVATIAAHLDTVGGRDGAVAAVAAQAGAILDPALAASFTERASSLLGTLEEVDPHAYLIDAEPGPVEVVPDSGLAEVATVFGDVVDLKTPMMHGHSRAVAGLATAGAVALGLATDDVRTVEVAALLHDVGRVGVSNSIWEKPGPLSAHEWEQVRLHPYYSERILSGSDHLAHAAQLVGSHHERLDGRGYHRGAGRADLPLTARVIAAADVYQAMTEPRSHRPALDAEEAVREMHGEVRSGHLDADAVNAVLGVAGHEAAVERRAPAGLTDREIEVLVLVASGCSNAEIAERLVISRRTAEHHVQHIYTKIGVSSRAGAALFAIDHGVLPDRDRSTRDA